MACKEAPIQRLTLPSVRGVAANGGPGVCPAEQRQEKRCLRFRKRIRTRCQLERVISEIEAAPGLHFEARTLRFGQLRQTGSIIRSYV